MAYLVPKKYSKSFYTESDYEKIITLYLISNRFYTATIGKTQKNLPKELWEIIIFRHLCQIKIKIGGLYIIRKLINNSYKEQIARIDGMWKNNNKYYFNYYYGIFGYHEGCCTIQQVKLLDENQLKKQYWELPQQFYQSVPRT